MVHELEAVQAYFSLFLAINGSCQKYTQCGRHSQHPYLHEDEPQFNAVISKFLLHFISFVPFQFLLKRVFAKFVVMIWGIEFHPKSTRYMMRPGNNVNIPVTNNARRYNNFIIRWCRLIFPTFTLLIASNSDHIVKIESKCIGLNSPTTFNEWIQKLLTLTISISATQE